MYDLMVIFISILLQTFKRYIGSFLKLKIVPYKIFRWKYIEDNILKFYLGNKQTNKIFAVNSRSGAHFGFGGTFIAVPDRTRT